MIFKELSPEQFSTFSKSHPLRSFLQTTNMANLQQAKGNRVYYLGVINNDMIIAATLIVGLKSRFGYYYTAIRGYLLDFEDTALLTFFTQSVTDFLKNKQGYLLNIDPEIQYQLRDINGDIVLGGFNNQALVDKLVSMGYHHNGFYTELDLSKQVRWAFVLDYQNQTEHSLFQNFKATTRNLIRKAIKYHVTVEEVAYDKLDEFKAIVDSTGVRKHFDGRPLNYYQSMYKHFHKDGYIKFLVAKVDLDKLSTTLIDEKIQLQDKLNKLSDHPSSAGKRKEYEEALKGTLKRLDECDHFKQKHGPLLTLAGGMFMTYGDETVYLYSGSYDEFMMFNGQYLIQWEIIKYGLHNGFKRHNFYGISGDFSKQNKRWGVYEFKRGFDGRVVEYIGDFDYILKPFNYKVSQFIKKLRRSSHD